MPFTPLQPPSGMDTDGLRKHGEENFREVARAWTEVEAGIAANAAAIVAANAAILPAIAASAVRYDVVQTLTGPQQLQADANISAVSYAAQTLSTAQKAQTKTNLYLPPTIQTFLSGSSNYAVPANCKYIKIRGKAGGGGGAGSGTTPGAATAGGNTTFSTCTANGGAQAVASAGGAGGTVSGGSIINLAGGNGGNGSGLANEWGGYGAGAQGGRPGQPNQSAGGPAQTNSGCGGGGGGDGATVNSGGGGAEGGYFEHLITTPVGPYAYAVGAAGAAGTAGTGGSAGGAGAAGWIVVEEFYS